VGEEVIGVGLTRSVLLLGATGLVGRETLSLLLADATVSRVVVIARRTTGVRHAKLEEHLLDLATMEQHAELFAVDQIVCALGTTIKQAGSQERFREVDHGYPLTAARLGLAHGARHYLIVTALGANASSRIFYNRVKGEVESGLRTLGYRSLTILRPSLLLGNREEHRLGETIASRLSFLMPPKMKPIRAQDVARALVDFAREDAPGVRVAESRELRLR
jgi:uncharacterized protein YbjT (DUF2867 family)